MAAQAGTMAGPTGETTPPTPTETREFSEFTAVTLEWRVNGIKAMYDSSKGEVKSKCIKSAVFGDVDNLWEVLFYPNSGIRDKDTDHNFASLYLWCVPTQHEREQALNSKWVRKGKWWFRFEVKVPDEQRPGKFHTLAAPKDASNHTFAADTATNWGWQKFASRDVLFMSPLITRDSFIIVCTITAQPQLPAGHWLGMGMPQRTLQGGKGLPWAASDVVAGGLGGGTMAGGGPKAVVPRTLVSAIGEMLDEPLYSDVEFVIPAPRRARYHGDHPARKIYANKRILMQFEYFRSMFEGGFSETSGAIDDDCSDDPDTFSDSDEEDDAVDLVGREASSPTTQVVHRMATPPGSDAARTAPARVDVAHDGEGDGDERMSDGESVADSSAGSGTEDENKDSMAKYMAAREETLRRKTEAASLGPPKTRVFIRDAAWTTWWALLYWIYTDTVYFAPLTSSFGEAKPPRTPGSATTSPAEPATRRDWVEQWLAERHRRRAGGDLPHALRPVSAKSIYRLADKLQLEALKLRAFQHIVTELNSYNVPAEVFSRFSSVHEEVRKVQVAFFLKNWGEIKKSDTMKNIWKQIRDGKHVGFEEVWPLIVGHLDFRPA